MRTISLFARVPLLLAAVAASHLPTASLRAAANSHAGPTEAAGNLNYQPLASDYYLDRTAQWIRRLNSK